MRPFLFLAACVAFALSVGGCAEMPSWTGGGPVSQKQPTTYKPYSDDKDIKPPPADPEARPAVPAMPVAPAPQFDAPRAKMKAAILLPLSGPNAQLGQAMLNAAQQAVFDAAESNFELLPRDTAGLGGPDEAARGAVMDGAKLIIGPLFAGDVPPVKLVAQVNGLMMLPLSTDLSVADRGVYVMGLAPGPQVERVMDFAFSRGLRNYAAIIPSTPYGALVGEVFRKVVAHRGGMLVDIQFYDPETRDVVNQIKELSKKRDSIEGLFLPEGEGDLKIIADQLADAGFVSSRTRLIGTGLWDTPNLGRLSPLLVGGWYAAPDPMLRRAFVSGYRNAYYQEPPRLVTLAYDATALACVVARRGGAYDEATLTNINGFAGIDGIFRLTLMGEVERGMAVIEVMQDSTRIVDPAPTSFMRMRR